MILTLVRMSITRRSPAKPPSKRSQRNIEMNFLDDYCSLWRHILLVHLFRKGLGLTLPRLELYTLIENMTSVSFDHEEFRMN